MKKTLLLSLAVLMGSTAFARQWDFTNWSANTLASIEADALWSSDEKGNGTEFPGSYWYKAGSLEAAADENGNLKANNTVIAETEGLKFTAWSSGHIAIATDYQTTKDANAWGPYHGAKYLWLAGGKNVRFVIPAVKPGTEISAGIESHKPGDKRGFDLYVNGTKIDWTSGQAGYPDAYDEYTWVVPEDLDAETVDVEIRPNNGCHLYFLKVDEGDSEISDEDIKVAYLYDATYNTTTSGFGYGVNGGLNDDPIYSAAMSYSATAIDIAEANQTLTTDELNDSLISYDVVVLSEAVGSGNKYAKALNGIINFVPMLNLKAFMYKNWGYGAGANPSPKATTITVAEDYLDSELFANLETLDDEGNITLFDVEDVSEIAGGNLVQGATFTAGKLFAADEIIAKVDDKAAIHAHGTKNQYMLIPLSSDNLNYASGDASMLVYNAIGVLAKTKSKVQNAAAPIVTQAKADKATTVSIASTTAGAVIYYTIDGSEPTEQSAVYSEPFVVTEDGIEVKAFTVAHGYNNSDIVTVAISVQAQAAAPTVTVAGGDGKTTITLAQADGKPIYYTFSGITVAAQAATYSEPIVVTEPGTIYAFSAPADALQSELTKVEFTVGGIPAVKDTVAHFTANQTDWFDNAVLHSGDESATVAEAIANSNQFGATGSAKAIYYFGKSAWAYYDYNTVDSTVIVRDADGNALKTVDGQDSTKVYYHPDAAALRTITSTTDPQWIIKTRGQVVTGETSEGPVGGVGNGTAGRYAHEAIDEIGGRPTTGFIDFGGKASGEPYSQSFETTSPIEAGEYDIVVYLGNGSTGNPIAALQTSTDGETWTSVVDTLNYTTSQRYYKKTRKHLSLSEATYIRVAQTSGSTKGYIYDIYVISTDGTTGIRAIEDRKDAVKADDVIYDLSGRRVSTLTPGSIYLKNGKKIVVR